MLHGNRVQIFLSNRGSKQFQVGPKDQYVFERSMLIRTTTVKDQMAHYQIRATCDDENSIISCNKIHPNPKKTFLTTLRTGRTNATSKDQKIS